MSRTTTSGSDEQGAAGRTIGGASLRDVYAAKALSQIPRLLSLQDRNEFSKTYGCFNREYWLCRSVDFPSSIAQFGVHSLAQAYAVPFPENPYYKNPKILLWTLAAIEYWMQIQQKDGSFDEFYPNERGWAGPTGFLVYAMCASYRLIKEQMPREMTERFRSAVAKAGHFLAKYDEPGVLANHHAMAILPIYEAYTLLQDPKLRQGFTTRLDDFLSYCYDEGWCLEYDGADLGYLSATVSFLSKLQKLYQDERCDAVCRKAIDFAAYFAYPNGHYAGSMGSRQTLHFYPHGFEIYGGKGNALASAVAERMLRGLADGALVPPEIQEDRYFLYRIPEFLEAWVDWSPRPDPLPPLPYEREPFTRYWPKARIFARKGRDAGGREYYALVNLAKGGVVKLFRTDTGESVENDCGFLARLDNGRVVTSQWIDPAYEARYEPALVVAPGGEAAEPLEAEGEVLPGGMVADGGRKVEPASMGAARARTGGRPARGPDGGPDAPGVDVLLEVSGHAHYMVMKLFTPVTMIGFRVFLLLFGWHTRLAYEIKGWIRKLLMTRSGSGPVRFRRTIEFGETALTIEDEIISRRHVTRVKLGDEFHVRYVPQSRYFQPQELSMHGLFPTKEDLATLNREGRLRLIRQIDYHEGMVHYGRDHGREGNP